MNNKIYEEALASALKRIEVLEDLMKGIPNAIMNSRQPVLSQQGYHEKKPMTGTSTPGQLGYIKKLGGKADSSMSKQEASNEIDRLLQKKEAGEPEEECESVEEPKEVDTEDVGIDEEGLI